VVTTTVASIPSLILGNLVLESFFGIPGLGNYLVGAIGAQDFAVVRAMVYLGTLLYIVGLLVTDILYALLDPRVRLT
jgi:peptide/nickel transport system permease protein